MSIATSANNGRTLGPSESPINRAIELIGLMTLEEKAMQVTSLMPNGLVDPTGQVTATGAISLKAGIGHVSGIGLFEGGSRRSLATSINTIQRHLVEKTRLGIPAIFHNEALNGVAAPEATVFPTAIALAATWKPASIEDMGRQIRSEMRSLGLLQALSPVLDVSRDARWGRVHETYGEDPFLVSELGVAYVRGLQGEDLTKGVIATAKHFLGYAMTEGGQNMAATQVTWRDLREVHARPFRAAIERADLGSVMNSYSEYDGVPIGASRRILTRLLREDLGFTGTVVSDYTTIPMLVSRQKVAADVPSAGRMALLAGMDVELPTMAAYGAILVEEVRRGRVPEGRLDEAATRVLRDKFALGLFEESFVDPDPIVLTKTDAAGEALALQLARESVTLLKNKSAVLPLSPSSDLKIAVVGPHADGVDVSFPAYTYPAGRQLMAFLAQAGESAMAGIEMVQPHVTDEDSDGLSADEFVRRAYGSISLADAIRHVAPSATVDTVVGPDVLDGIGFDHQPAVRAAEGADVVIVALGGRGGWFSGPITEGEGSDTANIDLPAGQVELVQALAQTGRPLIGVIFSGRPMALTEVDGLLDAIVFGYYGGQRASQAMAESLFGISNPAGRLPYTLPRHSGQVPIYAGQRTGTGYRREVSDLHKGYTDMPSTPLYAFGHGLSYSAFDYGPLEFDTEEITTNGSARASLVVTNISETGGDEVVQLYAHDEASGLTRPDLVLIGFQRVTIPAQQSVQVHFDIDMRELSYLDLDEEHFILEPGPITFSAGSSSENLRQVRMVDVVGPVAVFSGPSGPVRPAREDHANYAS